MASKMKVEKKQHIQVFTRVRPLSAQELRSQVVVECLNSKEVCVRDKSQTKTFTFDRVFGPDSKQVDVYKAVVNPLITEVLQGYNCTVFAYGQTGTGKTFTMVGDKAQDHGRSWEDDPSCGIIPRTLSHLFDELKIRAEEFTVRVSFLELYNEELCDLLAPNINDDSKNLRLYEDSMKKGSVIVSGLEERTVHNKDDVYAILEAGNLRRQTAPTLMNAQSSRSHTIFTITVHIKVTTPEGEDLIKTGKLNLVDLAGSENIGRSGAVDMRAREAGNINQSLLTLGRVITSLVERTPHIPYRESKLTRILQDSLGGRTKTSIIATVSPALCNIEETLSTFDYAHRARNITNKPEINQKTSKRVLLKEYTEEIERLRRDLIATREKHGVYLASDNYNAIMAERENLNKELISKLNLLKVREEELSKQEEILKNLNMDLFATQNELENTCKQLQETKKICLEREDMLNQLSQQTAELLRTADAAVADARGLHDRLDRSRRIQERNINSTEKFKNKYCANLTDMKSRTREFLTNGVNEVQSQIEMNKNFCNIYLENHSVLKEKTKQLKMETDKMFQTMIDSFSEQVSFAETFLSEHLHALKSSVDVQNVAAHKILSDLVDYSKRMNQNFDELRSNVLKNKDILERQREDLQKIQEKSAILTGVISQLPVMLSNKLKEQEEIVKRYQDKFEKLEAKERELMQKNEDFGRHLLQLSQDYVARLAMEKECRGALKNLREETKQEESNVMNDAVRCLQESVTTASNHTLEAEGITSSIINSSNDIVENYDSTVLPMIENMSIAGNSWCNAVKVSTNQNLDERVKNLEKLEKLSSNESERIEKLSKCTAEDTNEMLKIWNNVNDEMNDLMDTQTREVEKITNENLRRKQALSLEITEHSEELFSNIHHRVKEIEIFFSEGIQRDEKTGETPQRREFNYVRRIIGLTPRNYIESDTETNNGISKKLEKHVGMETLSEDKENFTCMKRLSQEESVKASAGKFSCDYSEEEEHSSV